MAQTATFWRADASEITVGDPLVVGPLNADEDEVSAWTKVTAKLPTGFVSSGNVTIDASGTSDAKWQLSPAADGTGAAAYGASLQFTAPAFDDNPGLDFWVRAKATSGETAANDTSVTFTFTEGICVAV